MPKTNSLRLRHFMHCVSSAFLLGAATHASADISLLLSLEPTSKQSTSHISTHGMEASITTALRQKTSVTKSEDLAEAMRSTRSGGYDLYISSAQIAASALAHGYELLGATDKLEKYVLVGRKSVASVAALKNNKLYLPQQDSIYTYMARGMLNASGLSLKDLKVVAYERYPNAGLVALKLGMFDSTVVRLGDWEQWNTENPGVASVLATSSAVPGGFSVVMKTSVAPEVRAKLVKWFATSGDAIGLKPLSVQPELADYKAVAQLGTFTPTSLPGAKLVTATEVQKLVAQGAIFVDTRSEKEFKAKRVPQAVFAPYHEKSVKDVVFDVALDDFSALGKLAKTKATIFSCNGAECWKSYKASKFAVAKGFTEVYWFRGGLPEWELAGLTTDKDQ